MQGGVFVLNCLQVPLEVFDAFQTSMNAGQKRDAGRKKQSMDELKEKARQKLKVYCAELRVHLLMSPIECPNSQILVYISCTFLHT